ETLPFPDALKGHQRDREKHLAFLLLLARPRVRDLSLHPRASRAGVGQDQQKLVVDVDRRLYLFVDLLTALDVVRGEPATDATRLKVGVKVIGEGLVFGAVANEAGVEVKGCISQ